MSDFETIGFGQNANKIIEQYGLNKFPILAFGSTAVVFANGDRVLRLSSDASSHCLIALANEKGGLCVPKMFTDYGAVGVSDAYPEWDHYWLAEIERLVELDTAPELQAEFELWLNDLEKRLDGDLLVGPTNHANLITVLKSYLKNHKLIALIETLIWLTELCNGDMDLNLSNFMLREATHELVVMDPAHGMEVDVAEWNARVKRKQISVSVGVQVES